jgi:hypothetical protein
MPRKTLNAAGKFWLGYFALIIILATLAGVLL